MPTFYCLSVDTSRLVSSIGINGAPLVVGTSAEGLQSVRPVNEWIMPQDNALTVFLNWPGRLPYERGTARLKAAVFRADPNSQVPKPAETVAQFTWPVPTGAEAYPFQVSIPFRYSEPPPATRLWQDAAVLDDLTDGDRHEMLAQAEELRRAIAERRPDDAYVLTQYKFDDDAIANGNDPSALRRSAVQQYTMFADQDNLAAPAIDEVTAGFRKLGDNRVVLLTRGPGEESSLTFQGNRLRARIKLYFGKIGGRWLIVR